MTVRLINIPDVIKFDVSLTGNLKYVEAMDHKDSYPIKESLQYFYNLYRIGTK